MNQLDEIAHLIQLSIAPVFLLTGIGTLLNVLSGRLARIIDRARVLEQRLEAPETLRAAAIVNELNVLENRGRLIYHAIKLSTTSALLVCFLIAALFATSMLSLFDSRCYQWPFYCGHACFDCQSNAFSSGGLSRN